MTSTEQCDVLPLKHLLAAIVVTDTDVVACFARDQSRFIAHSLPLAVLMPRTTEEAGLVYAPDPGSVEMRGGP
jgi:hypothetical protein